VTRRLALVALACAAALLGFAGTAAAADEPVTAADNEPCLACHGAEAGKDISVQVDGRRKSGAVNGDVFARSRHGALACTSCHLGFEEGPHTPEQTRDWLTTARLDACGNCHADQFEMYRGSFHGDLVFEESSGEAPVCADCHEPHNILVPSSAEFRAATPDLCARCHEDARQTYIDSFHGKATVLGDADTAICTDCHGGHRILPASDPDSMVSEQNLVATCATCHPGANENFAGFLPHVDPSSPSSSFLVWTFNILYLMLISVVFSFGAVHSGLYIYRGYKDGLYSRRH